jgi:hypothetical protein
MANGQECKAVITIDVATGLIDSVKKVIGSTETEIIAGNQQIPTPPGGFRHCCTVLWFTGSDCITVNLPGGGSFQICH